MKKKEKRMGIRINFKAKILGFCLPITIIMVIILIAIAYTMSRKNIIQSSEDLLNTSAKDQAHQIESWLNQKLREAFTVKFDIEHSDAFFDNEKLQQKMDSYYSLDSDFISGFYLSDVDGTIIKATEYTEAIVSPKDQVWFIEGLTRINPAFTGAYENSTGNQVISVCSMLNDREHIRVLSADLTLDTVNMIVNSSVSMKDAESLLIDKTKGVILAAREEELVSTALSAGSDQFLQSIAKRLVENEYGLYTFREKVAVLREISGTDWILVSYIPLSKITSAVDDIRLKLILIAGICILLLAVLSFLVVHIAVSPLRKLTGKIKAMSDGDFTITIDPKGNDEITDIQRSMAGFIAVMRTMILEINRITESIKAQADTSSTVSESMLEASKAQADSMSALNHTVDQFSVSIMEIAESATNLSNVVADTTEDSEVVKDRIDRTVEISKKGRTDMQRVSEAMNTIHNSIDALEEAINKVGDASKEITGIIGLIGDISEETALLSLNASIEAARAGDAGKGFAVVASQISKLADTTASSVENISGLIHEVDHLIADAVEQADVSVDNINESSERIHIAVNTFDDIYKKILNVEEVIGKMVEEVQVVNNVAMDVSAVSQEQAASTEVIHNTSETMVEQANNLATESEQVADSAKVLTQTSEELTKHMDRFRI